MVKCRKCGSEVKYLSRRRRTRKLDAYVVRDGISTNERLYEYTSQSFSCPKCNRVLFIKEAPAKNFMIEKTTSKW